MKKVLFRILIAVGVLIVLGLTTFLIISRPEPAGRRPPPPDYSGFKLEAKVGWYEIERSSAF